MVFENSYFLLALPLALIPLFMHLILRKKAVEVKFSALEFLLEKNRRICEILRFQSITLMLIRMLTIVFLTLAFAKPSLVSQKEIPAQSADLPFKIYDRYPSSTVIIIDDSFSMRYRKNDKTLFLSAIEAAASVIKASHRDSEFLILFTGSPGSGHDEFISDRGELLKILRKKKAGFRATDLNDSISKAMKELAGRRYDTKRIVAISDFRESSLSLGNIPPISEEIELDIIDVSGGESFANAGVTGITVQTAGDISPNHLRVDLSAWNFSNEPFLGQASIEIKDKISRLEIEGGGWSEIARSFIVKTDSNDFVKGIAVISKDNLPEDDEREFFYDMKQRLNILVLNGSMRNIPQLDETFYLEKALKILKSRLRINNVLIVRAEFFSPVQLEHVDILICLNVAALKEEYVSEIKRFVREGGSLLITAGDNLTPERYNLVFNDLLPLPIREVRKVGDVEKKLLMYSVIEKIDLQHPIFASFASGDDGGLREALFSGFVIPGIPKQRQTAGLASLSGGYPLLTEKSLGSGKILFYHSTFDRDWSDLVLRPAWITLIEQVIKYLSKGAPAEGEIDAGSIKNLPVGNDITQITVRKPDGSKMIYSDEGLKNKKNIAFTETNLPGVYEVEYRTLLGDVKKTGFAVRINPHEMNLKAADTELIRSLLKVKSDEEVTRAGTVTYKISLVSYCLLVLLILLLCEAAVAIRKFHG